MNVESIVLKSVIIVALLIVIICETIITVLHLKLNRKKMELVDAEIGELERLWSIDRYLLDVIPDDDDWKPDNAFVKDAVAELNARGIKATEAEVWNEMTDPDENFENVPDTLKERSIKRLWEY